jgi:hypothetical protein
MPSRSVASLLVALLISLVTPRVGAVSAEAEVLFREGRSLMASGDLAGAIARFARSYALEPSSGTLLNLALCHERAGKLVTALAEYETAARIAREQHRDDRVRAAEDRVLALAPKLAHLTIAATLPVPGFQVVVDGDPAREVGSQLPIPIDPGVHEVQATAEGHRPWSTTFEVKEGDQHTVEIPSLEKVMNPAPLPPAPQKEEPLVKPATLAKRAAPVQSSRFDLYLAVGGAALVASGAVAWGIGYQKFESAKTACNEGAGCPDYEARVSSIRTFQRIAIGTWIAGGAALLVSGLHYAFRRSKATTMEIAIDPWTSKLDIRATF